MFEAKRARGGSLALVATIAVVAATAGLASAAPVSWHDVTSPHVHGNSSEIDAMTATGTGDVWAFGFDRANIGGTFEWRVLGQHWDGNSWTRLNTLDRETAPAQDFIWGASATASNDVWIVGSSLKSSSDRSGRTLVEHWNGTSWSIDNTAPSPGARATLLAVSARTANDVWAVGEATFPGFGDYDGFVLHRSAGGWSQVAFGTDAVPGCRGPFDRGELDAVDAVGPNDVYVAGWCQSRAFVMHWNGSQWSLTLEAPATSAFSELATAPDGQIWVAGNRRTGGNVRPIVFHGNVASGWTQVPVRHSPTFAGNVDALLATADGVFIAGQLTDPHGNPSSTWALRLDSAGKWHKEPVVPNGGQGYARLHAATVEPSGTKWLGGTTVGGASLDPQSLVARRDS